MAEPVAHHEANGLDLSHIADQLQDEATVGYKPVMPLESLWLSGTDLPQVTLRRDIEFMQMHPIVCTALDYYRAGIAGAEFWGGPDHANPDNDKGKPISPDKRVAEFVLAHVERFWQRGVPLIQEGGYPYGWAAGEHIYKEVNGMLTWSHLKDFHPHDAFILTLKYQPIGVRVKNIREKEPVDLWFAEKNIPAKAMWYPHRPRYNMFYGRSQLFGAWRPWRRLAWRDGNEQVIDAAVYRAGYKGPVVRHPMEDMQTAMTGVPATAADGRGMPRRSARDIARQMVEWAKAGAGFTLSSAKYTQAQGGGNKWDIEWPDHVMDVRPLIESAKYLEDQIMLGIGVPPELVRAGGTGSGYSGRSIPRESFLDGQQKVADAMLQIFVEQVVRPLVLWNFGEVPFEISCKSLLKSQADDKQGEQQGQGGGEGQADNLKRSQAAKDAWAKRRGPGGGADNGTPPPAQAPALSMDPQDRALEIARRVSNANNRPTSAQLALWANKIQRACLLEAGDDVEAALSAAEYIVATQPYDSLEEDRPAPISAYFANDIYNRRAQGILNRALRAARGLTAEARADLEKALHAGAEASGPAILAFIEKYRLQLANLLTSTQLAAVLEGARQVAGKVPQLDADAQARKEIVGDIPQPSFPLPDTDEVHLPVIDEAVRDLSSKNVLTRQGYDSLDAAARAKAFTVAGVDAQDTLTKIRDVMAENVRKGADYETFRKEVLEAVDEGTFLSDAHQETIFRTNVQTAFSDGQMTVLQNPLIQSGFPYSAYDSIHDDRVRHEHRALDSLGIDGTNIYRNDDPVFQMFRPPWDYNCVLPDNLVSGRIVGALKANYSGQAVEIITSNGARVTLTVNHPVLTEEGFVAAGTLEEGQNLICHVEKAEGPRCLDHVEQRPALIEEVFNSLSPFLHHETLEAFNFDGDEEFMMGEVEVVSTYLPRSKLLTRQLKGKSQVVLVPPDNSRVSSAGLSNPLLLSHPRPLESLSLALTTNRNSALNQYPANYRPRNTKGSSNHILGFPSNILRDDRVFVRADPVPSYHRIGLASELDTVFSQPTPDGITLNPNLAPELLERFPGKVSRSKIINIRHFHYSGPVYDLETTPGYFTASAGGPASIIIRNCRCSWTPLTVRQAAEAGVKEAEDWLASGVPPTDPAYVKMPPFDPPPGFQRSLAAAPLSIQLSLQPITSFSTDAQGHEHRGKGPGGGQFIAKIGDTVRVSDKHSTHGGKIGKVINTDKRGVHTLQFDDKSTGRAQNFDLSAHENEHKPTIKQEKTEPAAFQTSQQPISSEQARAIKGYTIYASELNNKLRSGGKMDEQDASIHKGLQSAFANLKDFPEPITVYRGLRFNAEHSGELQKLLSNLSEAQKTGQTVVMLGYTSTTTSNKILNQFAQDTVKIEIKAKRGINAEPYSIRPEQKEIILDHKSEFRVLGFKKRGKTITVVMEQL